MSFSLVTNLVEDITPPAGAPDVAQSAFGKAIAQIAGNEMLAWFWAEGTVLSGQPTPTVRDAASGQLWTAGSNVSIPVEAAADFNGKPASTMPGTVMFSSAFQVPRTGYGIIAVAKMPPTSQLRALVGQPLSQPFRIRAGDTSVNLQHAGVSGAAVGFASAHTVAQAVILWISWEPLTGNDALYLATNAYESELAPGSFDGLPAVSAITNVGGGANITTNGANGPWNAPLASVMIFRNPIKGTTARDAMRTSILSQLGTYYGVTIT